MIEDLLPNSVMQKAIVTPNGEVGWRLSDVPEAIKAARAKGLACIGGQAQFKFIDGTCEPHWLNCDPEVQGPNESWQAYVDRSNEETLELFAALCYKTDFVVEAKEWPFILKKMEEEKVDPLDHLYFLLYFETER